MAPKMVSVQEAADLLDADTEWKRFQVDYPEAQHGRFHIQVYDIAQYDHGRLLTLRDEGMDRDTGHGTFRKLIERPEVGAPVLWMSDTRAEIMEHSPFFNKMFWAELEPRPKRILINGLGLGVVVHGALTYKNVGHIDVVERDPDVAALVGQYLPADKVTVHIGDAYAMQWPAGTRWDLAWHDIWPNISDENLPGMERLRRKYRRTVGWQGFWQKSGCLKMKRCIGQAKAGTLDPAIAFQILQGKFPI